MFHATLANSTDLDLWARRLDARSQLPRLLRRLVHATTPDARRIGFPADEGVQLGGWDGIVQAGIGNAFVPANISAWEMGADSNIKGKADKDYKKRCQDPLGMNPADAAFVFVTPRRWGGKDTWVRERNAESIWREVRAYDAEDLAQWLEEALGVHLWFSEMLGKHPHGALSLDNFWANWAAETRPPLHPSLVIGGREGARDRVLAWLRGGPDVLTLQGDSSEEATAFLAAVVQSLHSEERVTVLSGAVVVKDIASWRSLALSSNPLILISGLNQPEGIGRVIHQGHHVFVPLGRTGATGAFPLPRLVRDAAEQALKEMKLSDGRAGDLATLARRSLSALRRKMAIAPGVQVPAWAQPGEARVLLAPLLAGAWQDDAEGDQSALSQLAGIAYEDLRRIAVRWANEPDPPLRRTGNVWMVAAREDAWRLIAHHLTADDLNRLESVALDVLGERDPALELPTDKRFAAGLYGKVLTRSRWLRAGIAETLAIMATLSPEVGFATGATGEGVAQEIVWALLGKGDEDLWASLSDQLPLLAEASPAVFLNAVEVGLVGENPILVRLFQDHNGAGFGSSSPHAGLLRALERLAWSPDHLAQAALCLARLTRLDPGGRLLNRPAHSLHGTFVCWHPNTTAPLPRRLAVLDTMRKHEPEVAWRLLVRLLTDRRETFFVERGTQWRDWVPDPRMPVTALEYLAATDAIFKFLLEDVHADATRWCDLIGAAGDLTVEQRETLFTHLEAPDPGFFASDERAQLRDGLRKVIARHRQFPDAKWAMSAEHVNRMDQIYERFEPEDLIARHSWLFKHYVEVPGLRRVGWEERAETVERLRTGALREILGALGWERVLNLAEQVNNHNRVGFTLGHSDLLPINQDVFLRENLADPELWRNQMARGFVWACVHKHGESWVSARLAAASASEWRPEQYGEFFLCLPISPAVVDQLDAAPEEVQQYFWSRNGRVGLPGTAEEADRIITRFLRFDRPHVAVDAVAWLLAHSSEQPLPERVAEVLEASAHTMPGPNFNASFAYDSAELLDHLEKSDFPRERLARLEWMYLGIHEHYRRPRLLHDELARNPEFFVEVLQQAYRTEGDLQTQAAELLHSWKQMPGVQEDGTVDAEALRRWVIRVRKLATTNNQGEITDIDIGHALAFSPPDPDGAWPHQAVRDVIEELANADIESGWRTQIFNNRGVTSRLPTDGGEQEQVLAARYNGYAQQFCDRWPRTAAILRKLADGCRREATQEDEQAELTQDLWH